MGDDPPQEGELILYRTANEAVRVELLYEGETFWLDQRRMAELFGVDVPTVSYHLKEIFSSGELAPEATLRRTWSVQREGNREVRRKIELYHLDAIISVGYRIGSAQATQFRIWATQTLRDFIVKGFVLDDERLKLDTATFGRSGRVVRLDARAEANVFRSKVPRAKKTTRSTGGVAAFFGRWSALGLSDDDLLELLEPPTLAP